MQRLPARACCAGTKLALGNCAEQTVTVELRRCGRFGFFAQMTVTNTDCPFFNVLFIPFWAIFEGRRTGSRKRPARESRAARTALKPLPTKRIPAAPRPTDARSSTRQGTHHRPGCRRRHIVSTRASIPVRPKFPIVAQRPRQPGIALHPSRPERHHPGRQGNILRRRVFVRPVPPGDRVRHAGTRAHAVPLTLRPQARPDALPEARIGTVGAWLMTNRSPSGCGTC